MSSIDDKVFDLHVPEALAMCGVVSFTYEPDARPGEHKYRVVCDDGTAETLYIHTAIDPVWARPAVLRDIVRVLIRRHTTTTCRNCLQTTEATSPRGGGTFEFFNQPHPEKEVDA